MLYAMWTQTAVLLATAILICFYTRETSGLKKEMVRQNEISLRPVIVPILDIRGTELSFKLENIGVGAAFNVTVEPLIDVRPLDSHELRMEFRFANLSYLASGQSRDVRFERFVNGKRNPGPDAAFRNFLPVYGHETKAVNIVFDDVEGGRHRSGFKVSAPESPLGDEYPVELLPISKLASRS